METVEQVFICPACGHKNPASAKFCQNDGYPLRDGDPEDPLVGRLVGNYRLLQRKGEGGFGVVYLAEHNNLKTKYAVKILHPQFSANRHIAERFRRETEHNNPERWQERAPTSDRFISSYSVIS